MAFVRVESLIIYRALDLFRSFLSQYLVNAVGLWTQSVLVYLGKRYILSAFLECRMQEVLSDTKSLLSIFFSVSGVEHIDLCATNFFECPSMSCSVYIYGKEGVTCFLWVLSSWILSSSVGGGDYWTVRYSTNILQTFLCFGTFWGIGFVWFYYRFMWERTFKSTIHCTSNYLHDWQLDCEGLTHPWDFSTCWLGDDTAVIHMLLPKWPWQCSWLFPPPEVLGHQQIVEYGITPFS